MRKNPPPERVPLSPREPYYKGSPLKPYLASIIIVVCGLAFSAYLFNLARGWAAEKRQLEFTNRAGESVIALRDTVKNSLHEIEALRSLYISSYAVERAEFRKFVQHLLFHDNSIQALEWIPRVPRLQREDYEQQARSEGLADFEITERNGEGVIVRASFREEYYPVFYVEPFAGNEQALGFDLASEPARLQALESARDTGEKTATARISLIQERGEQFGVLIFQPLYRRDGPNFFAGDRQRNLTGFVLLVFRVGDLLKNSLGRLDRQGIDIHLFDAGAPESERFLAFYSADEGLASETPLRGENELLAGPHYAETIRVADRPWKVIGTPSPAFSAKASTWQPWGILALGLLLTGFLASYTFLILLRAETAGTHAVKMRLARDELAKEVTQHKRTEARLKEQVRLAEMRATIGRVLAREESTEKVLRGCTDAFVAYLGAAFARIWVLDESGTTLELKASSGMYTSIEGSHKRIAVGTFKIGQIAEKRKPHLTNSIIGDPMIHDQEWARQSGLVSFAGYPLIIEDRLVGVMGMFARHSLSDVTLASLSSVADEISIGIERMRSEERLRVEKNRAQNYFDVAGVMLVAIGIDKNVSLINKKGCEILGYTGDEIRGENWFRNFLPARIGEDVERTFERLVAGEVASVEFHENPVVRRDGQERLIAWHNSVITDETGKITGTLSSGEDITERSKAVKALEEAKNDLEAQYRELKKLDRMKDSLIRDVSHELKTPVAKHIMQLEILKPIIGKHRLTEEEAKAILIMEEGIRRQESVIRNLLDLSRLESGGRRYRKDPLRLDELITNVIGDYRHEIERHGIGVLSDMPALTIRSDGEMLWHLFSNIINNAIKFRKKSAPARISVFAETGDGVVVVRVADEGIGLSAEEKARVFERFYQRSASEEGSGVGLTICRRIALDLGGRIALESQGKGMGTVVVLTLPAD